MSWSDAKSVLVACILAFGVAGCGFQPMYATSSRSDEGAGAASAELAAVRVMGIADRDGQLLRNELLNRMSPRGEAPAPRYSLEVALSVKQEGLATRSDGHTTIGRNTIAATYSLRRLADDAVLKTGSARAMATFRYLGPRYASVATEQDAEQRAIVEVAEDIRTQLAVWFLETPPSAQPPLRKPVGERKAP